MKWYPLLFYPVYKEKIWGGRKLKDIFNKNIPYTKTGESFELSCFDKEVSIVRNGSFEGTPIDKLIHNYPADILGSYVSQKHHKDFPLLFKFIDANADLSIQVHPNEDNAQKLAEGKPKTEFWYIIKSDLGKLNIGFKKKLDVSELKQAIKNIEDLLSYEVVSPGESFLIKAGTVHSICSNVVLAEIQQASNTTYRFYDYDRKDSKGKLRELHIDKALRCIDTSYDFNTSRITKAITAKTENYTVYKLTANQYFTIDEIKLNGQLNTRTDYKSFNVLMFIEGSAEIAWNAEHMTLSAGDTVLLPSVLGDYTVSGKAVILNTYLEDTSTAETSR